MKTAKMLAIWVLVVLGLVLGGRANAVGATSSNDGEFAYVRIFSAKIADGIDKPLDELEAIARERGSEEVAMFPRSVGPEAPADRWIVRLGSEEHAYPGFTVKARTYLSEQRQRDKQRKISTLSVSNDGTRAVQVLPRMNARLEWTLPVSVQSPLLHSMSMDNKLLAVSTIRERLSPSGEQRWPKVIRIDLPQKSASIIQIFEYLDERPDGLSSFQEQLSKSLPAGTMVAEPFAEPLAKTFGSSGVKLLATGGDELNRVTFDYSWGWGFNWDTGWQPGGSPVQVRLAVGAGAEINSAVWGDFQLSRESLTNGQLKVGSGQGNLEMNFGAELTAKGKVDVWIIPTITFDIPIPYVPQFDIRSYDKTSFNSYLLDSTARVSDSTERLQLFRVPVVSVKVADITAGAQAALALSGEMRAQSISTSDGKVFTSEGQSLPVSLVDGTYDKRANYNEDLTAAVTVSFWPTIGITVGTYSWDLPVIELPWEIVSGRIDLDFSSSRLAFGDVPPPESGVLYVDADAPSPAQDGSSWTNAYHYLRHAINQASRGDEIWVAQGLYKPTDGIPPWWRSRASTFILKNLVTIKGGYAGYGEPDPYARDIGAYETVLSGDIGEAGDDADNCYHVVICSGTDGSAMLDGFTITGGNADGSAEQGYNRGGGMYGGSGSDAGSPTVTNCTFSGNSAEWGGGGMYNNWGSPTVINCTFSGNSASNHGGGMYNWCMSDTTVTDCAFSDNSAEKGGGMFNAGSSPTVTNCTFSGNSAVVGGAMDNAYIPMGGISNPTVTNCTFSNNSANEDGGGMYNMGGRPTVTNCILWDNSDSGGADESAQIYGGTPIVNYCCIQAWTSALGGTGNIGDDPIFTDSDGADDIIGTEDDNLRLLAGSPCIDAGDNGAVPADVTTDFDGNQRIINGIVDMGAYEYSVEPVEPGVCSYAPGDRVILLVDNPREATNLPAGTCGTVLCIDSSDPDLPILVSWDGWSDGYNKDLYCDVPPGFYPNNSAYWMACDQIAPFTRL